MSAELNRRGVVGVVRPSVCALPAREARALVRIGRTTPGSTPAITPGTTTPSMKRGRVSRAWWAVDAPCARGGGPSSLYCRLSGRIWLVGRSVAQLGRGSSCDQGVVGACRSEGFAAGEHVVDRGGELAGDLDPGDLGATLFAAATLGAFVVMPITGCCAACTALRSVPSAGTAGRSWPAGRPVGLAGLVDLGHRPV